MTVKIYTTTTCPYCKTAKEFMKEKGIKFTEINVEEDQKAAQEMIKKSGQTGVPVIDTGKEIIVGFDKEKLEALK